VPWTTPLLKDIRGFVRDNIRGSLPGADASIPNSVLRVLSDAQGGLCHLTLQFLDWLALQLLPDTAEAEWLDRHGDIWLVNADGSVGRKVATFSTGTATFIGPQFGATVPQYTQLFYAGLGFQTLAEIIADDTGGDAPIQALDPGSAGNLPAGTVISLASSVPNIASAVTVVSMQGGADTETDDELRARVLQRIREPPMGGDASDYVNWALRVPGVTRAWCSQEMGIGTVSVRFMMDDLRADNGGFPLPGDVDAVEAYINTVRPVSVEDVFVLAPIPYPVNLYFTYLDSDDSSTRAAIQQSLLAVFFERQSPGETWYRAWSDEGVAGAPGVNAYALVAADEVMPDKGHMPVLGDITYG
jgi:uncharacterized phage protein gp47/JayE